MVEPVLWQKVADEISLPGRLSEKDQRALAEVFSGSVPSSPWNRALSRLGMKGQANFGDVIRFVQGIPYFNANLFAHAVSAGTLAIRPGNDGSARHISQFRPLGFFRLLRIQWKLEKLLSLLQKSPLPLSPTEKILESLTLGLALQALLLRLPGRTEEELAAWLAKPEQAPKPVRPTAEKINFLQSRRNALSSAWQTLFEVPPISFAKDNQPAFFWNEPSASPGLGTTLPTFSESKRTWKGLPICAGYIEGTLLLLESGLKPNQVLRSAETKILVFPRAKPETTEFFSLASGIVFAEGGALAHACSVAREQGVPCISGIGREFLMWVEVWNAKGAVIRAQFDGSTGELSCEVVSG